MTARILVTTSLILLSMLAGCARPGTPPAAPSTPTLPSGWERYSNEGQCSYVIDHPSTMDLTRQGSYNVLLSHEAADPGGPLPNFIYISVIPDDVQDAGPGSIYNYDPAETQRLLNVQVGESVALREDPNFASWFTYTRLPDVTLGSQAAQAYENTQPWEFPPSTEEIRYYLKANGCTYLVGGYLATVGAGQPGAIDRDLSDQILASFRLAG